MISRTVRHRQQNEERGNLYHTYGLVENQYHRKVTTGSRDMIFENSKINENVGAHPK